MRTIFNYQGILLLLVAVTMMAGCTPRVNTTDLGVDPSDSSLHYIAYGDVVMQTDTDAPVLSPQRITHKINGEFVTLEVLRSVRGASAHQVPTTDYEAELWEQRYG